MPNKPKHATFGYIRKMERKLSLSNVPVMINYLCLGFYFHGEYFEKCGHDLKIINDKMSVRRMNTKYGGEEYMNTAYGKEWVQLNLGCIFTWNFRIDCFGPEYTSNTTRMYLGIISRDDRLNNNFRQEEDRPYFYFNIVKNVGNWSTSHADQFLYLIKRRQYQLVCDSINWRVVIYDMKDDEEVVSKSLTDCEITKDDTKYKLAISMIGKDATFTLTDFCVK